MNSDLYALLPPDKQTEYKQHQKDPALMPTIMIDESVPVGWTRIDGKLVRLPETQTCTWTDGNDDPIKDLTDLKEYWNKEAETCNSGSIEPIDIEMIKNIVKEFHIDVLDCFVFGNKFLEPKNDSTGFRDYLIEEFITNEYKKIKESLREAEDESYMRYLINRILGD